jgi:hypothetical protein
MSNKGKLVTAIILFVLMLPAWAIMWIKDSRQDPNYCQGCHADPYTTSWETDTTNSLAHQHYLNGVSCRTCHDRTVTQSAGEVVNYMIGNYYDPLQETQISMNTCFKCHESYAKMIPLTDQRITGAERNPHDSHWGQLECGQCHNMHRDSVDYCAACHNPVTDAPGWAPAPKSKDRKQ